MTEMSQAAHRSEIVLLDEGLPARVLAQLAMRGATEAARIFATCALTLVVDDRYDTDLLSTSYTVVEALLGCPSPPDIAILRDEDHPLTSTVHDTIRRELPPHTLVLRFIVSDRPAATSGGAIDAGVVPGGQLSTVMVHLESGGAAGASNQAPNNTRSPVYEWQQLRFRSRSEIRIAEALDRAGVLYFPNCRARLGPVAARCNREPDFLVCRAGRWGILEVDGEPFHQDAERDAARDALFESAGVALVCRYTATECYERPDGVVSRFLAALDSQRGQAQ